MKCALAWFGSRRRAWSVRCGGLTKLFFSIRTRPEHVHKALLIMFKAKPNDAATANEVSSNVNDRFAPIPVSLGLLAYGRREMLLGHYPSSNKPWRSVHAMPTLECGIWK